MNVPILSLLIFAPLLGAAVAACIRDPRLGRWWALLVTLAVAAFSLRLWTGFDSTTAQYQFTEHAPWIPFLGATYRLGVDGISVLLVLLSTLIMPLCVLCSWRYIENRVREFLVSLLIMEAAMVGVFCALDFVLFFVFWEFMLIPMALLIGVWGGPRRIYAALKFFIYTLSGSVLLLVAIIALYLEGGTFGIPELMGRPYSATFQSWVFLAFFVSFAIKVPMFPFHTWLPAAHVEAPTAGSVILASVLLKMGAYGFLRFALPITPLAAKTYMPYVLWLSVIAIIYGGLTALAQSDLKKLVAYSSVGHMGFATLGIFSMDARGIEGATLQLINHGVTTGALFICVGLIYERLHTRELDRMGGLGKHMPIYLTLLGLFCLSSMGFPGTNSFVGEFLVLAGGFSYSKALVIAAVPGVVVAAAYMLRLLQRMAWGGTSNPSHQGIADLNLREFLCLAPLAILVLWIGLSPSLVTDVMRVSVEHLVQQVSASTTVALQAVP
jgi:NADH-quinone oxidoreductase subunit M